MKILVNFLSFLRLFGSLVVLGVIITQGKNSAVISICLFAVLGLTDWLDGYLAKKYGCCDRFGSILDGVADAFLVYSVIISLGALKILPWWIITILIIIGLITTLIKIITKSSLVAALEAIGGTVSGVVVIFYLAWHFIHPPVYAFVLIILGLVICAWLKRGRIKEKLAGK